MQAKMYSCFKVLCTQVDAQDCSKASPGTSYRRFLLTIFQGQVKVLILTQGVLSTMNLTKPYNAFLPTVDFNCHWELLLIAPPMCYVQTSRCNVVLQGALLHKVLSDTDALLVAGPLMWSSRSLEAHQNQNLDLFQKHSRLWEWGWHLVYCIPAVPKFCCIGIHF